MKRNRKRHAARILHTDTITFLHLRLNNHDRPRSTTYQQSDVCRILCWYFHHNRLMKITQLHYMFRTRKYQKSKSQKGGACNGLHYFCCVCLCVCTFVIYYFISHRISSWSIFNFCVHHLFYFVFFLRFFLYIV